MPIYGYRCKECGANEEFTRPMSESGKEEVCKCGEKMVRNFGGVRCSADSYAVAVVSDSLAMNPSQIAAHRKLFPDIEVTKQGQPVFDSYKKHQAYLDKTGFFKAPKRRTLV